MPAPAVIAFRLLVRCLDYGGDAGNYEKELQAMRTGKVLTVPPAIKRSPEEKVAPETSVLLYAPTGVAAEAKAPLIVYLHGGGWCAGRAEDVSMYARLLAASGYYVANVAYALAPEYPFPVSSKQLMRVLRFLREQADTYGYDANRIFIGGNSAGAHLAAHLGALISNPFHAAAIGIRNVIPRQTLKGLLLYNGVYDFSLFEKHKVPLFGTLAKAYLGSKDFCQSEQARAASVIGHVTPDYPAVFMTVGDADPLEHQTIALVAELEQRGVFCKSVLWTGSGKKLNHDYIYGLHREEAAFAFEESLKFLKERSLSY